LAETTPTTLPRSSTNAPKNRRKAEKQQAEKQHLPPGEHRQKITNHELDGKAILPEPRSVEKAKKQIPIINRDFGHKKESKLT